MRLTEKKAIDISIELWEWLAETGEKHKGDWEGWGKYGMMESNCALCEYTARRIASADDCVSYCPYFEVYGFCYEEDSPFNKWEPSETLMERKESAKLFLEQLRSLK